MEQFDHTPVLVDHVLELAALGEPGLIVDCTLGGGGHAGALLETFERARLIGIDRDPDALVAGRLALARFGDRVQVVHGRFSTLRDILDPRTLRER